MRFRSAPAATSDRPWRLDATRPDDHTLLLRLAGHWRLEHGLPDPGEALAAEPRARRVTLDASGVTEWDSGLVAFAAKLIEEGRARGVDVERAGLPDGVRRLLALADAVSERAAPAAASPTGILARIGRRALATGAESKAVLAFLGEAALAFAALLRGRARLQGSDLALIVQECGPRALGIVTLISFLVGVILAFVGAIQLRPFGAQVYVADLVGIAMAQEMGAMMTAVIMAGRTGAAFAAQLGTMQVNEEIDALVTMGISPMQFLVLPRMLALVLMLPLLTLYADVVGIAGGAAVGVGMLKLGLVQYWDATRAALSLTDFAMGLIKGSVFGVLVAIAGCLRGMQCGRSSEAVGLAATSAVVTGIVFIIVSDAILTVIYNVLGL